MAEQAKVEVSDMLRDQRAQPGKQYELAWLFGRDEPGREERNGQLRFEIDFRDRRDPLSQDDLALVAPCLRQLFANVAIALGFDVKEDATPGPHQSLTLIVPD